MEETTVDKISDQELLQKVLQEDIATSALFDVLGLMADTSQPTEAKKLEFRTFVAAHLLARIMLSHHDYPEQAISLFKSCYDSEKMRMAIKKQKEG